MWAQVKLSPRLANHSPLQTSDVVGGKKTVGGEMGKELPFVAAASCCDI
jgi:hypothetical protein